MTQVWELTGPGGYSHGWIKSGASFVDQHKALGGKTHPVQDGNGKTIGHVLENSGGGGFNVHHTATGRTFKGSSTRKRSADFLLAYHNASPSQRKDVGAIKAAAARASSLHK